MPETEELRLVVTLDDQASAGLAQLRTQLGALGGGAHAQQMEQIKRQHNELTDLVKKLTEAEGGLGTAQAVVTRNFGALGLSVSVAAGALALAVKTTKDFSEEIVKLGATAQVAGLTVGQMRNIGEQMRTMGISSQESARFVTSFRESLADLSREGSQLRLQLMQGARTDPEAMRAWIARMTGAASKDDMAGAINEFVAGVNHAYDEEMKRTRGDRGMAADVQRQMLRIFGVDAETFARIRGQIHGMSEEEKQRYERLLGYARQFTAEWGRSQNAAERMRESLEEKALPVLTSMLRTVNDINDKYDEFAKKVDESFKEFWTAKPGETTTGDVWRWLFGGTKPGEAAPSGGGLATPQRFLPGFDRLSENIEDRRGEADETTKNTEQLARLNDNLEKLLLPMIGGGGGAPAGAYGFFGTGAGAAPGLSAGTGLGGLGPAGGRGFGGGAPYGSDVGPGTGAGAGATPAGRSFDLSRVLPGALGGTAPIGLPAHLTPGGGTGTPQEYGDLAQRMAGMGMHGDMPRFAGAGAGGGGLASARAKFGEELKDPALRNRLMAITQAEVGGQGTQAAQAFMESVMNRAAARGQTLTRALEDHGYYPASTYRHAAGGPSAASQRMMGPLINQVLGGSNISNLATGNASGNVGFGGGPMTFNPGTGERFGIEGHDRRWAQSMRANGVSAHASSGGGMDPMAPAGYTPGRGVDTTVITSKGGARFRVASEFAPNFKHFIDSYEDAGGVIGPAHGGLGGRGNPSYHPLGRAIDVNQIGYGIRSKTGVTLPQSVEDQLAIEAGLYPGSQFRRRSDIGHFEVRNRAIALAKQQEWAGDRSLLSRSDVAKVEGSGTIRVDVNAPKGTAVSAQAGGLFKNTEINRQTQMEPAKQGPAPSAIDTPG